MQRQILVLGANGFIGGHLMARLRACPWAKPIAGVRRPPASVQTEHRIVEATSEVSVAQGLAGIDAVVNCVAGDAASIAQGARALFAAAARMPAAPRVVHLSTISVYGEATGLIDETSPLRGDLGAYSAAKVEAEQYAAAYERGVILRPGCVYGPASPQWSLRIAQWLIARRLGDLGADGDGYCNLVHVDDVATAILQCLEAPEGAPRADAIFNLSMPEPPTWNEYLIRYGRALGAVPIRRISHRRLTLETKLVAPPLKILELGLRAAKLRWRLPPPIPPSLLRLMRQEIKLDVQRAQAAFGFGWKPLDAGLAETARWYLQEGARA
jgi:nucleoside-diphosphate-sugar epimerase